MSKVKPVSDNSNDCGPMKEKSFCSGNRELDSKRIKIGKRSIIFRIRKQFKKFAKKKVSLLRKNLKLQNISKQDELSKMDRENLISAAINMKFGASNNPEASVFNRAMEKAQASFESKMSVGKVVDDNLKVCDNGLEGINMIGREDTRG